MVKSYVVKAGDTLSKIAEGIIGDTSRAGAYEPS